MFSALPPIGDIRLKGWHVPEVPTTAVSRCSKQPLFDHLIGAQEESLAACQLFLEEQVKQGGDRFDTDCVRHHALFRLPRSSKMRPTWSLVVVVLLFKFGLDGVKQRTIDNAPHFGAAPTTVYPFTSLVGPAYNCPLQQLCHLQSTALSDTALRKEEGEGAPSATFWWPRTIQCTKATRSSSDDRSRAVHSLLCQTVGWLPSL